MNQFKVGTFHDAPDSLEKGCSEVQPLATEASPVQPAQNRGLRFIFKRHWIVLGVVALTWLAFSCSRHAFSNPRQESWRWAGNGAGGLSSPPPPPLDGDHGRPDCASSTNWTSYFDPPPWTQEYPHGAEITYSLPIDSDVLYLISRGPFQHGQVNIEQSTQVVDTLDVRVRVAYYYDEALQHVAVCQLERADGENGVGIFTPRLAPHPPRQSRYRPKDHFEFDVTLTLPAGKEGALLVKELETDAPNYSQNVADLQESVLFDKISLRSANGQLTVQSITTEVGEFSSLNGEIEGHFNARSFLDLHTVNGGITPTVNLLHREGAEHPRLTVHTINGQIDAKVSLTSEAGVGGEFEVNTESINGEIGLKFGQTPVDSVLRCHAETVVGKVEVQLDNAFEGSYSLRSVLGTKLVSQDDVEDPAGRGRRRVVTQNTSIGQVAGELKWVESDGSSHEGEGYVILKAVAASVGLVV